MNRIKMGYFPLSPLDKTQDVRAEMVQTMIDLGLEVEVHHHEVGGAGQAEIDLKYAPLLQMSDMMVTYKYIVKNVALANGLHATFMPKPLFEENGSGMHVHQSLWKDGVPLFGGDMYAGLSQMALWYIGGLIKHAGATAAFTNPITNSYRRLVPGYEAPVNLIYSARNRSAGIRIPMYSNNPKAKRVEARWPDPAANPYLCMPALLMAGIDGIKNQIDPGEAASADLYEGEHDTPVMPGTLGDALRELEANHDFLLEGGVFSEAFISELHRLQAGRGSGRGVDAPASLRVRVVLQHLAGKSTPPPAPPQCIGEGSQSCIRNPIDECSNGYDRGVVSEQI